MTATNEKGSLIDLSPSDQQLSAVKLRWRRRPLIHKGGLRLAQVGVRDDHVIPRPLLREAATNVSACVCAFSPEVSISMYGGGWLGRRAWLSAGLQQAGWIQAAWAASRDVCLASASFNERPHPTHMGTQHR